MASEQPEEPTDRPQPPAAPAPDAPDAPGASADEAPAAPAPETPTASAPEAPAPGRPETTAALAAPAGDVPDASDASAPEEPVAPALADRAPEAPDVAAPADTADTAPEAAAGGSLSAPDEPVDGGTEAPAYGGPEASGAGAPGESVDTTPDGPVVPAPEGPAGNAPEDPAGAAPVGSGTEAPAGEGAGGDRKRRRGRNAALVAVAAVLGVVAGTCAGYLVQADREPTALPPLSQPVLAQAKGEGPEPLAAAQDRRVKTDGDLRKLLLKKPRGAEEPDWPMGDDGWMDLAQFAGYYEESGDVFGGLVMDGFRRAAVTGWSDNDHTVEIRLVQFRQEETLAASESADNNQYWADDEADTDSWLVPGTGDGRVYVHNSPEREPGYEPLYGAEAHAWRGDVALEIWVYGTKPVPKKMIMDLAERQMERL